MLSLAFGAPGITYTGAMSGDIFVWRGNQVCLCVCVCVCVWEKKNVDNYRNQDAQNSHRPCTSGIVMHPLCRSPMFPLPCLMNIFSLVRCAQLNVFMCFAQYIYIYIYTNTNTHIHTHSLTHTLSLHFSFSHSVIIYHLFSSYSCLVLS